MNELRSFAPESKTPAAPRAGAGASASARTEPGADAAAAIHISVVIPVYGAEACLEELHRRLVATLEPLTPDFEILLVEDCGPDGSWQVIERIAAADPHVRGLQLSRNFGQHHAITAGLRQARGEWVVVMDCDLQDPPEEISRLYARAREGNDCVMARRRHRKDAAAKRFSSWIFYRVFNYLTNLNFDGSIGTFSLIHRRVVDEMNGMTESVRFYGGFLHYIGFPKAYVDIEHAPRFQGASSYTLGKLFAMALPMIIAYSNKPLRLCVAFGLLLSLASMAGGVSLIVRVLLFGSPVLGWSSLMVAIAFGTGSIILVLGIIGLYLDRIFTEVKHRPLFIVRRRTFEDR